MDAFTKNRGILAARWPDLWEAIQAEPQPRDAVLTATPEPTLRVNGIHLSSGYNREAEAALQASLIPDNHPRAWLYGPGLGDLPRLLLEREIMTGLQVVVLNLGLFALSLKYFDQSDWLADERVSIVLPEPETRLQGPFTVAPAWLKLVDDRAARIRDAILIELERPFVAHHYRASRHLPERLERNQALLAKDGDVASCFGAQPGSTVFVAAAGPTLSDHYAWLRASRAGKTLIAVDAALKPLSEAGITPDLAVILDEKRVMLNYFDFDLTPYGEVPLVYFPGVFTPILEAWPGPRLAAYPEDNHRYAALEQLFPRGRLFVSGSVLHPSVDLAVKLGASKVILLGVDFAFPRPLSHTTGSAAAQPIRVEVGPADWVLNGYGERTPTRADFRGHLRELEAYIARHSDVHFVNTSRAGARIQGASYEILS